MACISDNELAALVEGRVDAVRRAELLGELASCESCRSLFHLCLVTTAGGIRGSAELPAEIAGYRLGNVLGAGGGGVVVRARDPVLERDVALKLVRTAGDGDPAAHALREARTLATVRHPAVVQVYATGANGNIGFVAMELVDGASLAARLARGPLAWRDAVVRFADVATGLAAIHAAGLVHRDLKPGNLLVDGDRLRIADFGLAARDPGSALAGTLPYLAPELLAGATSNVRSDIYALFASLFEALTGDRPYRELDHRALRAAAEYGRPSWPASVPSAVRRAVERGLAPDPAARYPDANAAAHALRELPGTRRRRTLALIGVAGVALAGGVALYSYLAPRREPTPIGSVDDRRRLESARSLLRSRRDDEAIRAVDAVTTDSPLFGDAELIRGEAALDRENDVKAATAFRHVAELAPSQDRDDLAVAANQGLAVAIGVVRRETAAGEAYATAALTMATKRGDAIAAGIARRTLGWIAWLAGDADRANAELEAALGMLVSAHAPLEVATAEVQLARIARAKGDYTAATRHLDRAAALRTRELGVADPSVLDLDLDRAAIATAEGNPTHAIELIRGELARVEATSGERSPVLVAPLEALASALATSGNYTAAGEASERALAIDRGAHGEVDRAVGTDYANLAGIRVIQGKLDEAIELYRAGLAADRSALGDDHPVLAPIYAGLAVALGTAERYGDADVAIGHAIAIWRAHPGHDDELAQALAKRAIMELGLSRTDDARRDAESATAMLTRAHGPDHFSLLPALSALGQAELAAGHLDAARAALERVLAIRKRANSAPRSTVETRAKLAEVMWQQGEHDAALALARQALADLGAPESRLGKKLAAWLAAP